ncbi:unnamed protein product, partial [marine sediment metagenome]
GVLVTLWRLLVDTIDKMNPFYLPIDVPERDIHLQQINEKTGLEMETEWQVVRSRHGNGHLDHHNIQAPAEVEQLVEDIQPFLSRFYL